MRVLVSCFSRRGDCIAVSSAVNSIAQEGHEVTVVTLPTNEELWRAIVLDEVEVDVRGKPDIEWFEMTTPQLRREFPRHDQVINLQFGSSENHDSVVLKRVQPYEWLRTKVKTSLNIELPEKFIDGLHLREGSRTPRSDLGRGLAVIAPRSITNPTFFNRQLYADVKRAIETECRPRSERFSKLVVMDETLGMTFVECIWALRGADLFVGTSSGLAWASAYSRCIKTIYHLNRPEDFFRFESIDPSFTDLVVTSSGVVPMKK